MGDVKTNVTMPEICRLAENDLADQYRWNRGDADGLFLTSNNLQRGVGI